MPNEQVRSDSDKKQPHSMTQGGTEHILFCDIAQQNFYCTEFIQLGKRMKYLKAFKNIGMRMTYTVFHQQMECTHFSACMFSQSSMHMWSSGTSCFSVHSHCCAMTAVNPPHPPSVHPKAHSYWYSDWLLGSTQPLQTESKFSESIRCFIRALSHCELPHLFVFVQYLLLRSTRCPFI